MSWSECLLSARIKVISDRLADRYKVDGHKRKVETKCVGSPAQFKAAVNNKKDLEGFFYGGHGAANGVLFLGDDESDINNLLLPRDITLNHKVAHIRLFACSSAEDWPNGWDKHIAPGGVFMGNKGDVYFWSYFDFIAFIRHDGTVGKGGDL